MEVKYNLEELKEFIKNGKKVNYGRIGNSILYDGLLINFDSDLCECVKSPHRISDRQIEKYIYNRHIENSLVDTKQIDYLISKQEKVNLTKFPKGICTFNDMPVGVILPNLKDYQYSLLFLEDISDYELYLILKNVLLAIKELEENGIYKLYLTESSILYDGKIPKLIDLYGSRLKYGENDSYRERVYNEFISLLYSLLRAASDPMITDRFKDVFSIETNTFEKCENIVKRLIK